MKKWIGLTSLLVLSGCSNIGDGNVATQSYPVSDFNALTITSNIDTYITASPTQKSEVSFTIDENLAGQIQQQLEEGVLTISSEQNIEPTEATIHVTSPSLNVLTLDEQTQAWLAIHQFDDFSLNVIGNTDLHLSKVELEHFVIDVAGNANMHAMGLVKNLTITVAGQGELDLSGLNSHKARVNVTGNANVVLGTVNDLNVLISGNGTVKYKTGAQAMVQSNVSGTGSVTSYR